MYRNPKLPELVSIVSRIIHQQECQTGTGLMIMYRIQRRILHRVHLHIPVNLFPEGQHPENESRSVSQLKSQGQQNSGIRRTGAVQPKVTTIEDLENNRDQDLREWKDPVSDSTEKEPDRKNRKGFFRMIITAVVVITLIGGIFIARNVLESADSGNQASAEADDSDALNSGNFGTTDSTDKSFTQAMETIREHATTIEEALDSYKREGTEGERRCFYNRQERLPKCLSTRISPQMVFMRNIFTGESRCFIPMYGTVMRISISIIRTAF